ENVSHVPLEKFGGEFNLASTLGKLSNVSSEIGEVDKVSEGTLKQFAAGDPMHFNRKGIAPIEARPSARLTFATNDTPKFRDKSQGLWRRLLLVPFTRTIAAQEVKSGRDAPSWWQKSGELPGIFLWAVEGWRRLRERRRFTEPVTCQRAIDVHRL